MKISVVIPAYNEEKYIGECLKHCVENKTSAVCEIIVVDNASSDRTASIVGSFTGVTLLTEQQKGVCFARQRGIHAASGDVIAFIDADTHVSKQWFERIEAEFTRDPALVSFTGPYSYHDLPEQHQRHFAWCYWNLVAYPISLCTKYMAVGGNLAVRKSALEAIGGFDTSINFYGEDTDLARRLKEQGKVRFSPSHIVETSARRLEHYGLVRSSWMYGINFVWEVVFKRPYHQSSTDVR